MKKLLLMENLKKANNVNMNEVFNIKELSKYLKCSIPAIRKLIYSKQIPLFKIGNKYFFRKQTIDNWIIQQEENSISTEENKKIE